MVGENGREHAYQLCAPFSLLLNETKNIDILEYDARTPDAKLILPILGYLKDEKWMHDPGTGIVASNMKELVFEALSSSATAKRLRLEPHLVPVYKDKPRWSFNVVI